MLALGKTYNLTTELAIFKKQYRMKLHPDASNAYSIQSYSAEGVVVNGKLQAGPMKLCAIQGPQTWSADVFEDLTQDAFDELLAYKPELVIFGSGERLRFPKPEWQVGLMQRRVGLETMDTQAACRTYNILAGEGRKVAAALLIEASASKN